VFIVFSAQARGASTLCTLEALPPALRELLVRR
jgi:hypothetical protein